MLRQPAVADRFYDGDPAKLHQSLNSLIPESSDKISAKAVLSPHAGYIYSGGVAGETFARISIPETVILLGPNHHGQYHDQRTPLAVGTQDWDMPLGKFLWQMIWLTTCSALLPSSQLTTQLIALNIR